MNTAVQGEYFGEVALQGSHDRNATILAIEQVISGPFAIGGSP